MKFWERAEENAAKILKGSRVRGSGCGTNKSDISQTIILENGREVDDPNGYRTEVKSSTSKIFTIQTRWFEKISLEASKTGQIPALCLVTWDGEMFLIFPEENSKNLHRLNKSSTGFHTQEMITLVKEDFCFEVPTSNVRMCSIWKIEHILT